MAYNQSVSFGNVPSQDAQDYQIQQAQLLAQALRAQSMQPLESAAPNAPLSWTQGLDKLLKGYLAGEQTRNVGALLNKRDQQSQSAITDKLNALLPQQGMEVGGIDASSPGFELSTPQVQPNAIPGAPNQPQLSGNAKLLGTALAGGNPEQTNAWLGQQIATRLLPPPQQPFELPKGAKRFDAQGRMIAENPENTPLEHVTRNLANDMVQEGVYNKDEPDPNKAYVWGTPHRGHEPVGNQPLPALPADKGAVGMILTGMPINQAIPGFGRQASAERKAARDGAIAQLVIDHPGWSEMDAGTELAKRTIDFAGGKGAGVQTTKQLAANQNFLGTMDKNIANADSLSKQVGGDNSPAMNRVFNMWKRGVTGDPLVRQLDIYNNEIQGEAAKLASGGVGSVSATSDTQIAKQVKLLQTADNYAAWRAAAQALQQSGDNRVNSIIETIKSNRASVPGSVSSGSTGIIAPSSGGTVVHVDAQGNVIQ